MSEIVRFEVRDFWDRSFFVAGRPDFRGSTSRDREKRLP